jgi:hypothetical protein
VNGALNGLSMNLEVVRLKARPGADAGGVARFADVAAGELGATMRLVAPIVALARTPRTEPGPTAGDVAEVLRQAALLVAPVAAHDRVRVEVEGAGEPAPTRADVRAVRLAVVEALLAGGAAAAAGAAAVSAQMVEPAGAEPAETSAGPTDEPERALRCTLELADAADAGGAVLRLTTAAGLPLRLAASVTAALAEAGIVVHPGAGVLTLRFPPA